MKRYIIEHEEGENPTVIETDFIGSIKTGVIPTPKEVHEVAKKKGWYTPDGGMSTNFRVVIDLALIHSEVSEAMEIARTGYCKGNSTLATELADIVLRTFDLAGFLKFDDFADVIRQKHEYNKTRPYRHNNKNF